MLKKKLSDLVSAYNNDKDILDLICSSVRACQKYITVVCELELALLTAKHVMDADEYREAVSDLDKKRSLAHNNLISEVGILCRLGVKAGQKPIFEGNIEGRIAVAEFAKDLVAEIFESRRL